MADRLKQRADALDRVPCGLEWDEVVQRAGTSADVDLSRSAVARQGRVARRVVLAVALVIALAGASFMVRGSDNSVDQVKAGRGPTTRETPTSTAGAGGQLIGPSPEQRDDGVPVQDRLISGSLEPLDASGDYGQAITSVLGVQDPVLLRQVLPAAEGPPVVFDTVNLAYKGPGYQASIYHGVPEAFVREHDHAGFPTSETAVGREWTGFPSETTVSVALINDDTGVAVRVKYFDVRGGSLPTPKEVERIAINLSRHPRIVEEATR